MGICRVQPRGGGGGGDDGGGGGCAGAAAGWWCARCDDEPGLGEKGCGNIPGLLAMGAVPGAVPGPFRGGQDLPAMERPGGQAPPSQPAGEAGGAPSGPGSSAQTGSRGGLPWEKRARACFFFVRNSSEGAERPGTSRARQDETRASLQSPVSSLLFPPCTGYAVTQSDSYAVT